MVLVTAWFWEGSACYMTNGMVDMHVGGVNHIANQEAGEKAEIARLYNNSFSEELVCSGKTSINSFCGQCSHNLITLHLKYPPPLKTVTPGTKHLAHGYVNTHLDSKPYPSSSAKSPNGYLHPGNMKQASRKIRASDFLPSILSFLCFHINFYSVPYRFLYNSLYFYFLTSKDSSLLS